MRHIFQVRKKQKRIENVDNWEKGMFFARGHYGMAFIIVLIELDRRVNNVLRREIPTYLKQTWT